MTKKGAFIEISCDLPWQKQAIFGLLAAERFIKCYKIFSEREDFRDVICLLESMVIIENAAVTSNVDSKKIEEYIKRVNESIPDMDDYGSIGGSLALNVAVIVFESLNMIEHFEKRRLIDISTLCTDSIDFLILEIEDYDQMDFAKIAAHDLMVEEVRLQNGIVKFLENVSNLDSSDIETLRMLQKNREFDKLNLEEILYG